MSKNSILTTLGLILLAALLFGAGYFLGDRYGRHSGEGMTEDTKTIMNEAAKTVDERLPKVVPEQYEKAQKKVVKDRAAVHEEAQTLSKDALGNALDSELLLFDPSLRIR